MPDVPSETRPASDARTGEHADDRPTGTKTLVIGIGNRDRGDDGVGPAVVDELRRREAPVATIVREGDLADLALLWRAHTDVLIVDACRTGNPLGTVRRLDPAAAATAAETGASLSTHGVGVADAIELARRLGRLPPRLVLIGIEGRRFGHGPLSATLASELPRVVDEVEAIAQSGRRNGAPGWYSDPDSGSTAISGS